MKRLFIVCLVFVSACTQTPKYPIADTTPVSKHIKVSKNSKLVDISDGSLLSWDVNTVREYDTIQWLNWNYDPKRHRSAKYRNGVMAISGDVSLEIPIVGGEIASKFEYWLTVEARRLFLENVKTGKIQSKYQSNSWKSNDFFKFSPLPRHDQTELKEALTIAELTEEQSNEVIANCSKHKGWVTIREPHVMEGRKAYNEAIFDIREFHQNCLGFTQKFTNNKLHPIFANNPYLKDSPYPQTGVFQKVKYEETLYNQGLVEHLRGKYGKYIQKSLKTYIPNKVLITLPKFPMVDDYDHMKREYYFTSTYQRYWNSYLVDELFGMSNTINLYDNYRDNYNRRVGRSADHLNPSPKNFLNGLDTDCEYNNEDVQYALPLVTRISLKCWKHPYQTGDLENDDRTNYWYESTKKAAKYDGPDSPMVKLLSRSFTKIDVTYWGVNEQNLVQGVNLFSKTYTAFIQLSFSGGDLNLPQDLSKTKLPLNPLMPIKDVFHYQIFELAKKLPPVAQISWISPNRDKAYVIHHGILWEFPYKKLVSL